MHVMIWRYLCAWFRQLRSDPIDAVFSFLKYLSMLVTGYAIYCAAVSFMGGDIASGVYYSFLSVADGIACCCAWRAQRSRREWNATEAALEAGLAESQQQLQVRIDEALKRAADQTAWQIESAAARAVVDDSFGYDADTRDGISEIALSVGDLREADDQTLMDELGACGLSPESLSPEATRLTPHEQQTFRDLTRSLGQPE